MLTKSERKTHWEEIYSTKKFEDASWYQLVPKTSIDLINKYSKSLDDKIIDVGGGDNYLSKYLLEEGYKNLFLMDISEKALERAEKKVSKEKVNFICSDVVDLDIKEEFDIWHDRAVFHFFENEEDVIKYKDVLKKHTNDNSIILIATFSKRGPLKCSGIDIKQYDLNDLSNVFNDSFNIIETFEENHTTPSGSIQNFNFFVLKKK